jgi:hypothetical protein
MINADEKSGKAFTTWVKFISKINPPLSGSYPILSVSNAVFRMMQ